MKKETVILLHGILRSNLDMMPLAFYLTARGYKVLNIRYPSRRMGLRDLAAWLDARIKNHPGYMPGTKMHFVGHSLGALLSRYYIGLHHVEHMGRVVMLGPPNSGSEWADYLMNGRWLKRPFQYGFGPAGAELLTSHAHDNLRAAQGCEVGIIAGNRNAVPFAKNLFTGEHDGVVPVERTRLEGMTDHIVLCVTHTFMIVSPKVMRQTVEFLKTGTFLRA